MNQASQNELLWYKTKRVYEYLLRLYKPLVGSTVERYGKKIDVTENIIRILEDRLINSIDNIYKCKGILDD